MRKELTKEEIRSFARQQGVDADALLNIKKFLDAKKVRNMLIASEYKERIKEDKSVTRHIVSSLMEKYDIARSTVEIIIYKKPTNRGRQCVRCGQYITTFRWNKNNGICNSCIENKI